MTTSSGASANTTNAPLHALRHKHFKRFIMGGTIANCGQFIQGLSTPFLMDQLTGSPAWVGAAGFASLAPSIISTPIAGTLADRIDRKHMVVFAYVVIATMATLYFVLYSLDLLTPWRIIFIQLGFGGIAGFLFAPIQAMPAVLVPPEDLMSAVRMLSISFTGSRALGPLIGGLALWWSGPGLGFALAAIGFAFGAIVVMTVQTDAITRVSEKESLLAEYRAGLAFIRHRPGITMAIRNGFALGALGAAVVFPLAASVASDIYDVGGGGLGALGTAVGLGSIIASLVMTGPGSRVRLSRMEAIAQVVYIGGLVLMAITSSFGVGLLGFFVVGIAHMWHNVSLSTSMQLQVTDDVRGRVMSVWMVFLLAGIPLGALIGGFIASATSMRFVVLLYAGIMTVFLAHCWFGANRMVALDPEHAVVER